MEATTHTMLEVTKIWGLSWAFKDGYAKSSDLTPGQIERKVLHLPTVIEYLSFIHFPMGCLVGPYLEFSDYKNFIEFTGVYSTMPRGNLETLKPALTRYVNGLCCMFFNIFGCAILKYDLYFCGSKEFIEYKTIFHRISYFWIAMTF